MHFLRLLSFALGVGSFTFSLLPESDKRTLTTILKTSQDLKRGFLNQNLVIPSIDKSSESVLYQIVDKLSFDQGALLSILNSQLKSIE